MVEFLIKEDIDKSKIAVIIELFNSWNIKVSVKEDASSKKIKTKSFFDNAGMWKDYDIDAKELRKRAWRIQD